MPLSSKLSNLFFSTPKTTAIPRRCFAVLNTVHNLQLRKKYLHKSALGITRTGYYYPKINLSNLLTENRSKLYWQSAKLVCELRFGSNISEMTGAILIIYYRVKLH